MDWQLTHLYNPRLVVRDSIMPSYAYLFQGSASMPGREALDLLAYLGTLGRDGQLADIAKETIISRLDTMPGMAAASASGTAPLNGNEAIPSAGGAGGSAPVFHPSFTASDSVAEAQHGAELFAANCASCHGAAADGHSETNRSLLPAAANLLASRYTDERLSAVLWNGVYGAAMPAWREYSERDLRDLVAFVQHLPRTLDDQTALDSAAVSQAQSLFAQHCASCHGEQGDGRGPAAAALAPAPTNFHFEQPAAATALGVLEHGVAGTAMPAWTGQLPGADRHLLGSYVRSFFGTPVLPRAPHRQPSGDRQGAAR